MCSSAAFAGRNCALVDVSQGGISCEVCDQIAVGAAVQIDISSVSPAYHGVGEVVWCRPVADHFEVGVRFGDANEAYRSRMVQQICQIEHYKNIVYERDGRMLDGNEAAAEWIERHAADFPR